MSLTCIEIKAEIWISLSYSKRSRSELYIKNIQLWFFYLSEERYFLNDSRKCIGRFSVFYVYIYMTSCIRERFKIKKDEKFLIHKNRLI